MVMWGIGDGDCEAIDTDEPLRIAVEQSSIQHFITQ